MDCLPVAPHHQGLAAADGHGVEAAVEGAIGIQIAVFRAVEIQRAVLLQGDHGVVEGGAVVHAAGLVVHQHEQERPLGAAVRRHGQELGGDGVQDVPVLQSGAADAAGFRHERDPVPGSAHGSPAAAVAPLDGAGAGLHGGDAPAVVVVQEQGAVGALALLVQAVHLVAGVAVGGEHLVGLLDDFIVYLHAHQAQGRTKFEGCLARALVPGLVVDVHLQRTLHARREDLGAAHAGPQGHGDEEVAGAAHMGLIQNLLVDIPLGRRVHDDDAAAVLRHGVQEQMSVQLAAELDVEGNAHDGELLGGLGGEIEARVEGHGLKVILHLAVLVGLGVHTDIDAQVVGEVHGVFALAALHPGGVAHVLLIRLFVHHGGGVVRTQSG